jgi:hypothetical protein
VVIFLERTSFFAEEPATVRTRSGNHPVLSGWRAGDRVASYDLFGSPSGEPFHSVLGGNTAVFSNSDEIRDDAIIRSIPEPTTLPLLSYSVIAFTLAAKLRR